MTDVIFYDFDFNCLADFPRFISLNFEKKYCGYGTAEVHFSLAQAEVLTLLENNPYIFFKAGENFAVVSGWKAGEDIVVFGRTPEWLLTKRGLEVFSQTDVTPEVIVRTAVNQAAGDFVMLGETLDIGETQSYSTDKVRVLYDVICEVLDSQNLGFKVVPDISLKSFVFSVYEGKESLCLISLPDKTAYDMTYTVEKQDMVTNSGWYEQRYTDMGKWDARNNSPSVSNNKTSNVYTFYEIASESYDSEGDRVERFGLWCRKGCYLCCDNKSGVWKIVDAKPDTIWVYLDNSDEAGAKKWDAVISGTKTEEEALAEIAQLKRKDKTESETKGLVFGEDYLLGDIVRVQTEFGDFKRSEKKRVTSVSIYYDIDKSGVIPTLNSLEE